MFKFNPWKSLTIWGGIGAASQVLVSHYDPAAVSPTVQGLWLAGSIVLGSLGARNAVAKAAAEILAQLASKSGR